MCVALQHCLVSLIQGGEQACCLRHCLQRSALPAKAFFAGRLQEIHGHRAFMLVLDLFGSEPGFFKTLEYSS